MATTTPNFGWVVPTSTDLVKDGATAIETLGDSIDASLLDLKGGTSGQVLAKNSNTDMDFVWVAQDDSNAIQNAIVDAKGDLIAATAADTPARLAVGTNGQVLTADSTAATGIKWATPAAGATLVGCSIWNNVDLTVNNNTMTSVTYNSENYDTDGYHSTSSNTNRITIPAGKAGKYEISCCIQWDNSSTGLRQAFLFKNGAGWLDFYGPQSSASRSTYFLYTIEDLSVGDYLSIEIKQTVGGALTAFFNGTKNYFTVNYLGA